MGEDQGDGDGKPLGLRVARDDQSGVEDNGGDAEAVEDLPEWRRDE